MSGDVQPRKRKDKRRKKEEEDTGTPPPTLVSPADNATDNVSIHIYKESSTGGHWCARIIFFTLLAVLVGLIGIIIFEHRGTTDVDTPLESSRWAFVFDGWVDDSLPSHDEEPHEEKEHDEASEETGLEEGEEEEDHDEDEEDHDEDEEEASKEEEEQDEDEGIGEEMQDEEEEEETEADGESAEEEDQNAQDDEEYISSELNENEDEGIEQEEDEDGSQQEFDDAGVLEEVNAASDEQNVDEDDTTLDDEDNDFDVSTEADEVFGEMKNDDESEEFLGIPGVNEIDDDNAEPLEEVEGVEPEEDVNDLDIEPEEPEEIEEESASVAVKFGVGVALVVAAHFVLVRRWNNVEIDNTDINDMPDLSRRNTVVPPSRIKEVVTPAKRENEEQVRQKKQSQTYEALRPRYNRLEVDSSTENVFMEKPLDSKGEKVQAQNIRSAQTPTIGVNATQARSKVISSEEEDDGEELETSEGERVSGTDEYEEEEQEEVTEEEEEEDVEEEEEEIETIDDSELIAKLEAKYGKLPTPQQSEEEEEEEEEEEYEQEQDEEEEEDEEAEEDDDISGWKRVNIPKNTSEEPESTSKPGSKGTTKVKQDQPTKSKGGARVYGFNISNIDDIVVREENDSDTYQEHDD